MLLTGTGCPFHLCRKFDLKGSTVDREASDKELEKNLPTLKDNDFIKQKIRICIGDEAKQKLFEALNADTKVCIVSTFTHILLI